MIKPPKFIPGDRVIVGDDIPAVVTQSCLSFNGWLYKVAWWDSRTYSTEWLSASQIQTREERGPIEFSTG